MTIDYMDNEYFNWLCGLVSKDDDLEVYSYRKLMMHLHSRHFRYSLPMDSNRADDGVQLRRRYSNTYFEMSMDEPCSILEMMVALAVRCEETIMDNAHIGNRTGQWFWNMITSLGLGDMHDERINRRYVEQVIERFLNREYDPDGRGGLFTIRNCEDDLREVEIWYQLMWYLDTIV